MLEKLMRPLIDTRTRASAKAYALEKRIVPVRYLSGDLAAFLRLNAAGELRMDTLKYPRPVDLATAGTGSGASGSWNVYTLTSQTTYSKLAGGVTTTGGLSGSITFASGEDAVVYPGTWGAFTRLGGLTLSGGRNIAVIAADVDQTNIFAGYPASTNTGSGPASQSGRKAIQFINQTGDRWLEGAWIRGNQLGDAVWITDNPGQTGNRKFTIQNCLCEGMAADDLAAVSAGVHSDWIQVQIQGAGGDGWAGLTVESYGNIVRSAYQAFTTNQDFAKFELERTFFDMNTTTNWDGSRGAGYSFGFYTTTSTSLGTTEIVIGPDVSVVQPSGNFIGPGFPENWPEWQNVALQTGGTVTDPSWKRTDYGRTYVPPMPVTALTATASSQMLVRALHGSNASYPRPITPGGVQWQGSVQPTNALSDDVIILKP